MTAITVAAEQMHARRERRAHPASALMLLFIAAQCLSSGLLLLPGSQQYRFAIRSTPYVSSLLLLLYFFAKRRSGPLPPGAVLIGLALALLVFNLAHADSHPTAGLA